MELIKGKDGYMEAIRALYEDAFPPAEKKPFAMMEKLEEEGRMEILAAVEEDRFVGLCITINVPESDLSMLDYFAISPEIRGGGYGSKALRLLLERFRGRRLIFEIERLDDQAENAGERRRRKSFYMKNGLLESGLMVSCFGVDFELLLSEGEIEFADYERVLHSILSEEYFRNAKVRLLSDRKKKDRVLVIIPAYNEVQSICGVVDELRENYPQLDYLVVTDGSSDGTAELCAERGYHLLRLPVNLGLGGCFQAGMKYACRKGYDYAVQFDGDGQHRPEYILPMLRKMQEGYDLVLGSRFLLDRETERQELSSLSGRKLQENEMHGMRSLGSLLIRCAIRLTTGVTVTDPTCGLRMYSRRLIDDFANKLNYAPEPDTISFLIKNGARTAEVPVRVADRESGQSYLRPVRAAAYMLKMLTSILLVQNFRV